jgi:hypothetical protein
MMYETGGVKMKLVILGLALVSICAPPLMAQEVLENANGETAVVEGEAPAASNQGESASDIAPQVAGQTGEASNAINIDRTESGYRVMRGTQIVEAIEGSEGVTGIVQAGEGFVYFTPTGRPQLRCMESGPGHFPNCKMDQISE